MKYKKQVFHTQKEEIILEKIKGFIKNLLEQKEIKTHNNIELWNDNISCFYKTKKNGSLIPLKIEVKHAFITIEADIFFLDFKARKITRKFYKKIKDYIK